MNLGLGATYFATKLATEGLPDLTIVALRVAVASALLAPLAGWASLAELFRAGRGTRVPLLVMGVAGFALPIALGNVGVRLSTATNGALLIGVEPISVALLGALVLGERLGGLRILALALGVLGATTVVANGIPFVGVRLAPHLAGDLVLVAHGIAWSIYSIAGKPLLGRHPPIVVTAGALVVSLPILLPLGLLELRGFAPGPAFASAIGWTIALGVFASALGALFWNHALRQMDASQLAAFVFLQPLAGVVLGALVLGEPLSGWTLAGGTLVFAGVYALLLEERRSRRHALR